MGTLITAITSYAGGKVGAVLLRWLAPRVVDRIGDWWERRRAARDEPKPRGRK